MCLEALGPTHRLRDLLEVLTELRKTDVSMALVYCSKNLRIKEFPSWLVRLRAHCCLCRDAGSILGLAQWVKDLALPKLWCRMKMWLRSGVAMAMV